MAAAAPAGVLLLEGLGVLAGPGVHLAGGEHAGSGIDLLGIEVGPGGEGHRGGVEFQRMDSDVLQAVSARPNTAEALRIITKAES